MLWNDADLRLAHARQRMTQASRAREPIAAAAPRPGRLARLLSRSRPRGAHAPGRASGAPS
jgi:hypothetical protein